MIERENILTLLGRDSSKYHSCIITSYSFDFTFFENRILPMLHRAGISNVIVFVDAAMLEIHLGAEHPGFLTSRRSYSLVPVAMKGAFHPKILLAVGKTKGMLAVGSGNFTSSGIQSNEEIWSAFHYSNKLRECGPIFFSAEQFLKQLYKGAIGINLEKIKWAYQNSEWVGNLVEDRGQSIPLEFRNLSFSFFSTNADKSLLKGLMNSLPQGPVKIKVLSPFYNKNGGFIHDLHKAIKPQSILCIVDSERGTLPYKTDFGDDISFCDWQSLNIRSQHHRMHAKAFQFEYDSETYFFLGSANATSEAWGTEGENSKNSEAGILIFCKEKRDFFKEMGLEIPEQGDYDIRNYQPPVNTESTSESQPLKHFIQHAEYENQVLKLWVLKTGICARGDILLLDKEGEILELFQEVAFEEEIEIKCKKDIELDLFKVVLKSQDEFVSGFRQVSFRKELERTNPDERRAKLQRCLEQERFDEADLLELLDYVPEIISTNPKVYSNAIRSKVSLKNQENEVSSTNSLSEEEYNQPSTSFKHLDDQRRVFENSMIIDFLEEQTFGQRVEGLFDSSEREAELDMDKGSSKIEEVPSEITTTPYDVGVIIRRKVAGILNRTTGQFIAYKNWATIKLPSRDWKKAPVSFERLQNVLMGCHFALLLRYSTYEEKRYQLSVKFNDENKVTSTIEDKALLQLPIKKLELAERALGLKRLEIQDESNSSIIRYSLDEKSAEVLRDRIKEHEVITLLYLDQSPSIEIHHPYFRNFRWPVDSKYSELERFVFVGVSSFVLQLINRSERVDGDEVESIRFNQYGERLLYKILILLLTYSWPSKADPIFKLLILNSLHALLPTYFSPEEIIGKLEEQIEAYEVDSRMTPNLFSEVVNLIEQYKSWISSYTKDPKLVKVQIAKGHVGSVIFYKRFGFARISRANTKGIISVTTPLGGEMKGGQFGFDEVFVGSTPAYFFKLKL